MELWNTHKGFLKQNFPRLVDEIKAQRWAEQETGDQSGQQRAEEDPPPLAGGLSSCNDGAGQLLVTPMPRGQDRVREGGRSREG